MIAGSLEPARHGDESGTPENTHLHRTLRPDVADLEYEKLPPKDLRGKAVESDSYRPGGGDAYVER